MLGILGLGSHTTTYYINEMNNLFQKERGGYSTMPFKLLNTDFNDINPFLPNQFDRLKENCMPYIEALEKLDVSKLLIPNITLHEVIDKMNLLPETKIKLFHPVDLTAEKLKLFGVKAVCLFGSIYTMNANYITSALNEVGIKVNLPSKQDQEKIDLIRRSVYENGSTDLLQIQIENIAKAYTDVPILIACTELSILRRSVPHSFDMVQLQIEAIVKHYSA